MLTELWSDLRYRLRAVFRRRIVEQELDAELRFHVEREAEKYVAAGMSRGEALRQARLAFGGIEQMKEVSRDARGTRFLEAFVQDVWYAVRSLRKQPSFAVAVVLTLAIGIGANTATFTLIDALLLRPLPVPHPEELVTIGDPADVSSNWHGSPMTDYVSYPLYVDVRDGSRTLSGVYATGPAGRLDVVIGSGTRDVDAAVDHPDGRLVSGNYFSVLQLPAYLGRTFTAREDRVPLGDPVVVISYDYWRRRFAGDRAAVGSTITVNGTPFTIIGVAPPGFTGDVVGRRTDLWIPIMMQPAILPQYTLLDDRSWSWFLMMGRLAPGVTLADARAELTVLEARAIRAHLTGSALSEFEDDLRADPIRVEPGARGFSRYRKVYGPALAVLMAAVSLVVLVVCANVANLMLARAVARSREMTVRMTLGAGRLRLMQQLLTESVLLAAVAGVLGLVVAAWGSRLLLAIAGAGQGPIALDVALDARVLVFTAGVTLLSVILFGLVPALRATRLDLATALRAQGRNLSGARGRFGRFALGRALVVGQVALSTVLLVGTGILVHSMQRILTTDLGLDRDHIVIVDLHALKHGATGQRLAALAGGVADRVQQLPGVRAVSYSEQGLFSGGVSTRQVTVPGFAAQADSELVVDLDLVGPNYFHALGGHLIRGRDLDARDSERGARAAVIDETMAKDYFRGVDPIGRTITMDSSTYTIVGVVRDVQEQDVRAAPVRRLYLSISQSRESGPGLVLYARVSGPASRLVPSIRAAVLEGHPDLPIDVVPLDDLVRQSVAQDLLLTEVTMCFGIIALVLAAVGLYGVTSYATTQRIGEFGLRSALGAQPRDVTAMVLGEALRLVFTGVVIALPAGLAATHLIRAQVFGVGVVDMPSLAAAVAALMCTALVASYLPARRAARVGPLEALRTE